MLSSADVMKLELFLPKGSKSPIEYLNQRMKVRALARRPALTVSPHASVESAAELMARNGVHALAVVDSNDGLLGIVTTTDILHAALRAETPAMAPAAAVPGAADTHPMPVRPEQLDRALAKAVSIAGGSEDPDSVHAALLFVHSRLVQLEHLRQLASRYLQAGQDVQLHAALKKALDEAA